MSGEAAGTTTTTVDNNNDDGTNVEATETKMSPGLKKAIMKLQDKGFGLRDLPTSNADDKAWHHWEMGLKWDSLELLAVQQHIRQLQDAEERKRKAEESKEEEGKRSRSESTLQSKFGIHTVTMQREALLEYIEGCQFETKIREIDAINSKAERDLELHGRKDAFHTTVEAFRTRKSSITADDPPNDRTNYPIVVYSGMSGLGKTRMLEECRRALVQADVTPNVSVIITYGNGHNKKEIEETMSIEASFGWRLLHRIFVEDNYSNDDVQLWHTANFLPANANELTLDLAIQVVQSGARNVLLDTDDKPLSLFIGVDEYQKIPKGTDYDKNALDQKKEREKSFLWKLLEALDDCRRISGLHIYLALAGTEWGPLNIAGSSLLQMSPASMTFLDYQETEDVVRSIDNQKILESPDKRRKLFFLGGIPRPSVKFALKDGNNFETVWNDYISRKWSDSEYGLSSEELLRLIAFAVSGLNVIHSDKSGIKKMKWGRLVDNGFCMITEEGCVGVPYCVFRIAAMKLDSTAFQDLPSKCLLQNLKYMQNHVDESLFIVEPWQAWETFGACYFSMRVNALKLLGQDQICFADLCKGAVVSGCQDRVNLFPMEVHTIEEQLSKELEATVTEKLHRRKLNWVAGGLGGVRYCLINGVSGKGVDFFATLPLADGNGLVLYNDQRKMVASSLGDKTAKNLLQSANISPNCLGSHSKCVRGVFSALASFDKESDIPDDCVVLSHSQSKGFYGALSVHPACKPFVDVNFDNVSTLRLLNSVRKLATLIIQRRSKHEFKTVEEFCGFCKSNGCAISDDDRFRVVAKS